MSLSSESRAVALLPFTYRAIRADGTEQLGELSAASRDAAREQLASTGVFPVDVRLLVSFSGRRTSVPTADLALGLRLLGSLLGSGLPLERALGIFPHIAPRGWEASRIAALRTSVREGLPLARAFRDAGFGLPPHVSGMIEAGEAGGTLVEALREVAQLVEQSAEHRAAVHGALAYPAILAVAGTSAVAMLVGVVLPRFSDILSDIGQELPPSARLLMFVSALMSRWWPLLLGVPVAMIAWSVHTVARDAVARRRVHEWLLALPVIGPLRHATAGARVASALSSMLGTGVPIASALAHGALAAGDDAISARVLAAREGVIRGERLSHAFAAGAVVRPGVLQLIRAGEATGELGEMLKTSARIEAEWSMARIRTLTRLIEPSLILCFGGAIAFVAAALLQAVYSIRPTP